MLEIHEPEYLARLMEPAMAFTCGGYYGPDTAALELPGWRAVFSSLMLWGSATGARIPTAGQFIQRCQVAYTLLPLDEIRTRLLCLYHAAVTDAYLYTCLVDVVEHALREGVVFYDPRRLDGGIVVAIRGRITLVSLDYAGRMDRLRGEGPEPQHATNRTYKRRAYKSEIVTDTSNKELRRWAQYELAVYDDEPRAVNGYTLPSYRSLHCLMDWLCNESGVMEYVRLPALAASMIPEVQGILKRTGVGT